MKLYDEVSVVNVADEYMIIPLGERAKTISGIIIISEEVAFLLEKMKKEVSITELTEALISEYDVSLDRAKQDITNMINELRKLNLISK